MYCYSLFVFIYTILKHCGASFIDTNHPIVISDGTTSGRTSYFGYSISGFSSTTSNRVSIYIGAPTSERTSSSRTTLDTGDVWECQVNLKESKDQQRNNGNLTCTPWNGLAKTSKTTNCCPKGYSCTQYSSGMWLGGSLAAVNENGFVTCGPRWSTQVGRQDRAVHGQCYHAQNGNVQTLEAPLQYADQVTNLNIIWLYGQTGFSSALDFSKTLLMAGAPGHLGWRGNAILYNLNEKQQSCQSASQFNTVYETNARDGDPSDYFGYHVASGRYSYESESYFAVGAPRGYNKDKNMAGFVSLVSVTKKNVHGGPSMQIRPPVIGEQLGSYFGAVAAFADVNGDNIDELFVGAPFYTVGHNSDSYDEGCVFVYSINNLVDKLCPSSDSESNFGFAIANIGDIDQDGLTDVAIGAPGSAKGLGEVFIYYGHSNFPLSSRPNNPQRIGVSEINKIENLRGFGSTLFGNIDIDGNQTPDILIGSSSTNQIVIYRTRPRLELTPNVINRLLRNGPEIYKLDRDEKSLLLHFCVTSLRQPKNDGKLEIRVEAKFDPLEMRYQFGNKTSYEFSLQVITDNEPICGHVRVDRIKEVEVQNPGPIRIIWKMKYTNSRSDVWDISTLSVAANGQARLSRGKDIFCTWCPKTMENVHEHFISVAEDNCDKDGNKICNSKLKVIATLRIIKGIDIKNLNKYTIGLDGNRFLDVYIENHGETAYSPTVVVDLTFSEPTLSTIFVVRPTSDNQKCSFSNHKVVCRDPLHTGQREHLSFIITTRQSLAAIANEENLQIKITAYPGPHPEQSATSNPVELKFISDVKLTLTGINSQRKDININEPNAIFKSSYEITNSGTSPVKDLYMKFQIPAKYEHSDNVLETIIIYTPQPQDRISCVSPDPQGFPRLPTNALNNNAKDEGTSGEFPNATISADPTLRISLRRRQTHGNAEPTETGTKEQKQPQTAVMNTVNMVYVDCVKFPKWKCVEMSCTLQPLSPLISTTALTVDLNLAFIKNATDIIIPSESAVFVTTTAEIWTFDDKKALSASAMTNLQAQPTGELPAYLIFVSGIGGLIIFLAIVYGLFQCGFFRRKTKEQLENLKAQAEQEDILAENFHIPSETNDEES